MSDDFLGADYYGGGSQSSLTLTVQVGEGFTITAPVDELVRSGIPDAYIQRAFEVYKREIEKEFAWALPCPHCGKKRFDPVEQ